MPLDAFPLFESYGDPEAVPLDQLGADEGGSFSLPGWRLDRAHRATLAVTFGDRSDPALQGVYPRHGEDLDPRSRDDVKPIETLTLSVSQLFASKGQGRLEVEIARIDSSLAEEWANAVLAIGSLDPGARQAQPDRYDGSFQRFAYGMSGTIGYADRIVRLNHNLGNPQLNDKPSDSDKRQRSEEATNASVRILQQIRT